MRNYNDELLSAVARNHIKKIAAAAPHVEKEIVLKSLRFAVFQHRSSAVIEELVKHAGQCGLNSILLVAVNRNHMEAFDVVWNYVDPHEDKTDVLKDAVRLGRTACVRKLLRQQNISNYLGGTLLAQACFNQDADMVDLLYGVCDPQAALDDLNSRNLSRKHSKLIVQRLEQEQLRAHLRDVVGLETKPVGGRKL